MLNNDMEFRKTTAATATGTVHHRLWMKLKKSGQSFPPAKRGKITPLSEYGVVNIRNEVWDFSLAFSLYI